MDLTLGEDLALEVGASFPIDPYDQAQIDSCYSISKLPHILQPTQRALFSTREEICIPKGYVGFIQLRSTFARLGLLSPPTVADPGFIGNLTMEVFNGSLNRILLRPLDKVWSIHLIISRDEPLYLGKYQNQKGLTLPKALSR